MLKNKCMKKLNNDDEIYRYYGYIYITTNLVNGKRYIGQKKINRNWKNYLGSGLLISKAIKKYGKENFSKVIIDFAYTAEELNKKEEEYISFYNAVESEDFYNLQSGGSNSSPSVETIEKIRKSHIGLLTGENHPFYGKHHTEESRKKMSESLKGRECPHKGKKKSDEEKAKLKISRQRIPRRFHKPIICVEIGKVYDAVCDAERELGYNQGRISKVLCGKRKTTGGYHWQYYQPE